MITKVVKFTRTFHGPNFFTLSDGTEEKVIGSQMFYCPKCQVDTNHGLIANPHRRICTLCGRVMEIKR